MNRRGFLAASAMAMAAVARTRGMQLHLSAGAIGLKVPPHEVLAFAAKYGFDAIDADTTALDQLSPAAMKERNIAWALAGLPVEFRRDEAKFNEGMAALPAFARKVRAAGVERVTTWLPPSSKDLTYRENFRLHSKRLGAAARVLHGEGLRFGMEYVAPKTLWAASRYPFIHTMRELRELIADMNVPQVGIVLDSWHWYHARDTRQDILALKNQDIISVDLNDAPAGVPQDEMLDSKRELPAATGVIDVKGFLSALQEIGFDGPVRAEPFNQPLREMPPDDAVKATAAALKKAFAA
jgi:sugar phosphate isomerase/epimerase